MAAATMGSPRLLRSLCSNCGGKATFMSLKSNKTKPIFPQLKIKSLFIIPLHFLRTAQLESFYINICILFY